MSWAAKTYRGPASDYEFELQSPPADARHTLGPRQQTIVESVADACEALVEQLGDVDVSVSAYGHSNAEPAPGDTVSIAITTVASEEGA